MTNAFVKGLEKTAQLLAEFAEAPLPGARTWNGFAYVESSESRFDPFAAKWSSILTVLAEFLDGQDEPLTDRQKEFLNRLLFGGMGSLNDLVLDANRLGSNAKRANKELGRLRTELFAAFQSFARKPKA
jgi:hypothetical protein